MLGVPGKIFFQENEDITLAEYIDKIELHSDEAFSGENAGEKIWSFIKEKSLAKKNIHKGEKLDVFFLPYKYSMWDSLESIWEAAARDSGASVTLMPVPYFTRKPGGEYENMYYEIDDFKRSAPVTDFREINLKERHPDIVFIHNPYDGTNTTTSVYLDYYAKELRNQTDMLVYVPYNIFGGDKIASHYGQTPGVLYADYVMLQSEFVKNEFTRFYCDAFAKRGKEDFAERTKDKFVVLGSPKLDRLFNKMNNPDEIPNEWVAKIDQGFGRRKVVFFNTHVNYVMDFHSKTFGRRIRSIIDLLKNRNDVVFIWRPHPLSFSTIKAMNPEFLEEYENLINAFKNLNNGILDDSEDTYRSLCMSDAYYGAYGSLGEMYSHINRPILFMDMRD